MTEKLEKIISYGMLVLLIVTLLPVMYLGRFNHPTGDDYYYGAATRQVLQETGSITATVAEAAKGVGEQYMRWQGTYSAMFLMYLPPQLFGDWAYKAFPTAILLTLVGGIFYLLKPLVCQKMGGSKQLWILVSSAMSLLCVQTVPVRGETFYWYNGSMYYTGFFALTLYFLGVFIRYLGKGGVGKVIALAILGLMLGGGNYVSLLPTILLLAAVLVRKIVCASGCRRIRNIADTDRNPGREETQGGDKEVRQEKCILGCVVALGALLLGLCISALAPGNALRQSGMWQIPAWKAVAKSLLQGLRYISAWTSLGWILIAVILTPFLWRVADKIWGNSDKKYVSEESEQKVGQGKVGNHKSVLIRFMIVIIYGYGVFCSMSCPTFYTMNSTGPGRAVAIVYYGFVLTSFAGYTYFLGFVKKLMGQRKFCGFEVLQKQSRYLWGILSATVLIIYVATGGVRGTSAYLASDSLLSGEAKAYEAEYQGRLRLLEDDTVKDVELEPYRNRPVMLYVGDFSADINEPTNRKVAEYYDKNSVRVNH